MKIFRKHQKLFFVIITAVIVVTLSFFGTYETFNLKNRKKDKIVATGINGISIKQSELNQLIHFLSLE